jgi:D-apionolactonase
MRMLTERQLWYGVDRQQPETRELRAGPITALLDGIDLRYVRIGSLEVVRRIYVAVRDQNWNTIPGPYRITRIDQERDWFEIRFEVEHLAHDLDFGWQGWIVGSRDGQIRYEMDGVPKSDFRYNRIGLCILHPFRESAGSPYQAQTPQGEVSGHLPELIGPQRFENGFYVPLFPACSSLTVDLSDSVRAHFNFEGDLFEMEDQRNWTDASFKTYCTPLSLGFPHQARVGVRIAQSVTIRVEDESTPAEKGTEELRLSVGQQTSRRLPTIGFGMASDGASLTAHELELLRRLKPDHLRVDIHLTTAYSTTLERAIETCQALGCDLEAAIFVTNESGNELDRLASLLKDRARVARFLIFQEGAQTATPTETTVPGLVELVRQYLRQVVPQATFAGGTDMYFCELNRTRPLAEAMDGVSYTIIPQAHAFDERSLSETLEAQGETVKSARSFCGDRPVIVSPITLKRRYNPHATVAETERASDELPDAVDPRQMSLFGAAWTAGSIKNLAESGAASLTYYETTGWLGLMERETGSPLPELFPSAPGMIFPLYHVFAGVAEWKDGFIVECVSNRPLAIAALAVESGASLHLQVVNLTGTYQRVVIGPLTAGQVSVRSLDASTVQQAMFEPESFRQNRKQVEVQSGELVLDMAPYATVRIDRFFE